MSNINQEKKKNIINLGDANGGKRTIFKSPLKNEKLISKENISISETEKNTNYIEGDNNNFVHEITENKDQKLFKGFIQKLNKIGEFGFNENNTYMLPINNRDLTVLTDTNIYDNNNTNINNTSSNPKSNTKKK